MCTAKRDIILFTMSTTSWRETIKSNKFWYTLYAQFQSWGWTKLDFPWPKQSPTWRLPVWVQSASGSAIERHTDVGAVRQPWRDAPKSLPSELADPEGFQRLQGRFRAWGVPFWSEGWTWTLRRLVNTNPVGWVESTSLQLFGLGILCIKQMQNQEFVGKSG